MKLYKIIKMVGNRGVSVFPPEDKELPHPQEAMTEPISDLINKIMFKGYTYDEAFHALAAWAYHAKFDLNQGAVGVRSFCARCALDIPFKAMPPEPIVWAMVLTVAVVAAVALGLYAWVVLDQELNVTFGSHKWAYVMSYEERLWQAEILNVGWKQEGVYERGGYFGEVIASVERNFQNEKNRDWIWFKPGRMVLEGRRVVFYHSYRFIGFFVYWCGVMSNFGAGLYKLREGGNDPYKPLGIWTRPGGRWGKLDYEGCWGAWWWL